MLARHGARRLTVAAAAVAIALLVTLPAVSPATTTFTGDATFRFSYPVLAALSVSRGTAAPTPGWAFETARPGTLLAQATLRAAFQPKTNFADSTFTVGTSADPQAVATCLGPANGSQAAGQATIGGVPFAKFVQSEGAAGNLYELHRYRTLHNGRCWALEYAIHSLELGNFGSGSGIHAFDRAAVEDVFAEMVLTFRFR
jgi:hypothetical protein